MEGLRDVEHDLLDIFVPVKERPNQGSACKELGPLKWLGHGRISQGSRLFSPILIFFPTARKAFLFFFSNAVLPPSGTKGDGNGVGISNFRSKEC
jgi:hypothetical protein